MIKKWCESSSCDGIWDLYESRRHPFSFVFWLLTLALMLMFAIFFTYRTIQGYIDTPTVTDIETVSNPHLDLPEALICYNGGLNASAMKEANLSENFQLAFALSLKTKSTPNVDVNSANVELLKFMDKNSLRSVRDVVDLFGYKCIDIVIASKRPFHAFEHKCENITQVITSSGICFKFYNNDKQWFPNLWGGMSIKLRSPTTSFVRTHNTFAFDANLNDDFSISFEKEMPHYLPPRSLLVPINARSEITLNLKHNVRLGYKNKCSDNEYFSTSSVCYMECWLAEAMRCCNCVPLDMVDFVDSRHSNGPIFACNTLTLGNSTINIDNERRCCENCVPLCSEWIYEPTITYSTLETELHGNEKRSIVVFGFNTMEFVKIEEVHAFTLDMAISNVGGQLGLWLGISIVTIIQALYYLTMGLNNSYFPIWRKTRKQFTVNAQFK